MESITSLPDSAKIIQAGENNAGVFDGMYRAEPEGIDSKFQDAINSTWQGGTGLEFQNGFNSADQEEVIPELPGK